MLITKLQSEIYFGTLTSRTLADNVIIYVPAVNYYGVNGSIGSFTYSLDLGNSWNACTLASSQLEPDLNNIPLNELANDCGKRKVPIVWAAAEDISILNSFTNVMIKITFYDQPSQAGTESEAATLTIDEIDMVPTETVELLRPYVADNVLSVSFKSLVAIYDIKSHYRLQVAAEIDTEFATPLLDYMSEADQTGWTLDGNAFPNLGAPTQKSIADVVDVTFSSVALAALPNVVYNMRILRSLHDPPLPPTYPEEW